MNRSHDLQDRSRYDPAQAEPRILERWLQSGLFHPEPEGSAKENYSIVIPPPNVTGELHMGHALNSAIQDVLIRYHRMRGERTKWVLGTDHAGIATQAQVEKQLATEGQTRKQLGREEFEQRVWQWCEHYGQRIISQLQRLGASCDYEGERFTLDEAYALAVNKVFAQLYAKGYIYRDRYLVNWDPGSHSAISDLEVEEREVAETLYYIDYPLVGSDEAITIATVRPETMLADTAVAVHPDDERYKHLIGRLAVLPLVGRELPIIADDYVKPEFGTGALKITPAHDPNDFEIGRRHNLDQISVIGEDGCISSEAPTEFVGMTTKHAQAAVVEKLSEQGFLSKSEPYTHTVPFSHRSGERIEPLISLQWFMRMDELAQPAIAAIHSGKVRMHPQRWAKVYLDWMENIRPWCISRQLWWGHRLPVWYCDSCSQTYVAESEPPQCSNCGAPLRQEEDVLDTWFSSALWPFVTLGWPAQTPELKAFYPTDVLSTARDIIFLWVARMIMMGLEFRGEVPFHDVYIHSVIQAPDGRRMSKSLGTGIDPIAEIDVYGADGVRFGLLAMSSAQDVRYSQEKLRQGQALANKLWNASRLILLGVQTDTPAAPLPQTVEDRWILSRLQRIKKQQMQRIDSYSFSHGALELYDFVYSELCDWYLELVKPRLYDHEADRSHLSATLLHTLSETLAIAHPFIPFVTEEIWSYLPDAEGLLAGHTYPQEDPKLVDEDAERQLEHAIAGVKTLRRWRDEVSCKAGVTIPGRLVGVEYGSLTEQVARLAHFSFSESNQTAIANVTVEGGSIEILPNDAVDFEAAAKRRAKRQTVLEVEIARAEGKLANKNFVAKAPPKLVESERKKLELLRKDLDAITQ
jgi:valyl-tRNA synthetase